MDPAALKAFIIDWQIQIFGRQAAAHWAAGLNGFESFVIFDAAADIVNDFTQGDTQWDFDQAGVFDIACQGKGFSTLAFLSAHAGKPFWSTQNDLGYISVGFNVVIVGRFVPHPLTAGKGGLGRGSPRFPSIEAMRAVSSPQTKAPAPFRTSRSKSKPCQEYSCPIGPNCWLAGWQY